MPDLRIFGNPIHDIAIVFIVSCTIFSIIASFIAYPIEQFSANVIVSISFVISFCYWFKEYRKK